MTEDFEGDRARMSLAPVGSGWGTSRSGPEVAWHLILTATFSAVVFVWAEFVPFLEFPPELRRVVYTTNAIESLNARFRRAVRHRGHFPNEQAA